ncbi:hypothetical protein [Saccharopolyspora hordei]|uniref:Uncharacterized protein n=1 Tax=Saccharopolyspora hordei TaxID=1838 RepID=A0A853AFS2_9PSEU|nr:hypothetical protein [Saccharopolyspora hordei]NYI82995.1 hypothetical protein [Saccharopolyspora hordei]
MNARVDLAIVAALTDDLAERVDTDPARSAAFLRHLAELVVPWSALRLGACRTCGHPDRT